MQLSQLGRQWRERTFPIFETVAKVDSKPGSLECESGILPPSYRAPPTLTNSPANIQLDPPHIATEGFSSDSLSERSPEQHTCTKNRGKSRRANIIFFGKMQNGSQKHNFVYYSVILNTKM